MYSVFYSFNTHELYEVLKNCIHKSMSETSLDFDDTQSVPSKGRYKCQLPDHGSDHPVKTVHVDSQR